MEDKQASFQIAQIVLISSLLTFTIILGALFISRHYVINFLAQELQTATRELPATQTTTPKEPVIEVVEKVNPAVVSVVITKDVPVYEQYYESWGFFNIPRVRENGTKEQEVGGGSGFIVSNDGLIVTNNHVVSDESARYSVLLNDGTNYTVEVLARDSQLDVAVLKINQPIESALTFIDFGDSSKLELGQTVIAIGNALAEFQNSVSVGVVSGLSRSIVASDERGRSEHLDKVIQTDAAINPGNSGGPLLNLSGEVIGVNVATSRGAENIGFALPAEVVKQVVDSVKQYGEIVRPFLGARYTMVTSAIAKANNLSVDYGALITRGQTPEELAVMPGSPADKVGLVENDIILSIDSEDLKDTDLSSVLRTKSVGQVLQLKVLSKGEEKTITVTLEKAL